ncbi:helix-turn-helix transcriptional regulator [Streptomyces macrosporus]|uniref:HTH luxR-type domain-containing protein n=1 Tax=Streptomyces macrosporus TaxID=44032 RepID=A0ABN3KF14_9ACTN
MTGPLTDRELAVIAHAAQGHSYRRIGRTLHTTEGTVSDVARRAFRKLGAANMAHAVHLAHERGLIALYAERERAERAEAAVERVRALHQPLTRAGTTCCAHCSGWDGRFRCHGVVTPWPCPTLAALDGPDGGA